MEYPVVLTQAVPDAGTVMLTGAFVPLLELIPAAKYAVPRFVLVPTEVTFVPYTLLVSGFCVTKPEPLLPTFTA